MTPEQVYRVIGNAKTHERVARAHIDVQVLHARKAGDALTFVEMVLTHMDQDLGEDGIMAIEALVVSLACDLAAAIKMLAESDPPPMPPI